MPISFMKVAGSANYSEVNTYADLPAAATAAGMTMLVLQETGTWILGTLKRAGLYYSDGSTWTRLGNAQNFFYDDKFAIKNVDDTSKQLHVDVSEVPTATVRTMKAPPEDGTLLTDNGEIALGVEIAGGHTLIDGFELSIDPGNTTFSISSGVAFLVDNHTDPANPTYTKLIFPGASGISPQYLATNAGSYPAFDSDGNLVQLTEFPSQGSQLRGYLGIGAVSHPNNTTISGISQITNSANVNIGSTLYEMNLAMGRVTVGNIFSAASTDLTIARSSGRTFTIGSNYKVDKNDPNYYTTSALSPVTFVYTYRDGAGGWTLGSPTTTVDPNNYDTGTGSLITVNNNKWTIQTIYLAPGSGTTIIHYGQQEYATEAEAVASINTSTVEVNPLSDNLVFRGWLIVEKATTNLQNATFLAANKFGDTGSVSGSYGATSVTLEQAYVNSTEPEITTTTTRGAVSIKGGTGTDTDKNLSTLNNAGTETFSIQADGTINFGDSSVDGSWRIKIDSGAFSIQKRISGVWEAQFNVTGA